MKKFKLKKNIKDSILESTNKYIWSSIGNSVSLSVKDLVWCLLWDSIGDPRNLSAIDLRKKFEKEK